MGDSTPICRCRVLYLGSAVPRQSKDGLQGIQEPLRSLYPSEGAVGAKGIDSWLSVWSNGILLENVDENLKQVTRFFPIESLHYCAAVRQVMVPERGNSNPEPKFLPLDSPFARMPRAQHPPIFAAILRRTTGIKVLECHTFICKREAAANALVRCCFHAYADNSYAKQLENGSTTGTGSVYGTLGGKVNGGMENGWRSRTGSTTTLNSVGRQVPIQHHYNHMNGVGDAYTVKNVYASSADLDVVDDGENSSLCNGDENHKVWNGSQDHLDAIQSESPYDIYSGGHSTLGRPARQRQISAPVPAPPPPKEELRAAKKSKDKKSSKPFGSQSLSGTLIRPRPMHVSALRPPPHHMNGHGHPPMMPHPMYGHPPPLPPHGPPSMHHPGRQFHTIGHRSHHMANGGGPPQMHGPLPMPMPLMMPQQYATLQVSKTGKKSKKKNGIPIGVPVPPPMFYPPPPHLVESRPLSMSSRKLAQSAAAGLDDSGGTTSGADSPNGTGIYRRKGHLNERAFSYSIRQEHRSRSHGSLASLQFSPPDLKKEREIAQMVAGLELNGGGEDQTLRRRENGHHVNGHMNGHGTFGKPRSRH